MMQDSGSTSFTGRDVDLKGVFEELQECVLSNDLERANSLVMNLSREDREVVSGLRDNSGGTLLFHASYNGRRAFVKFLVDECGADIEQRCDYEPQDMGEGSFKQVTPLFIAAAAGELGVVMTLVLQLGADVNAQSWGQTTPVHAACCWGNNEVVRFLIENGADINSLDKYKGTCLMFAAARNDVETCRCLLQKGVSINDVDNRGDSALHCAISADSLDCVSLLLESGADPLICNKYGDDALQTAALHADPQTTEYLIQVMEPSPQRRADMYALFAARSTIYPDPDGYVTEEETMSYWIKSIKIRMEELTEDPIETASVCLNAVYNFAVEAKDIDSLKNIDQNGDAMDMQALVVQERILGSHHPKTVRGLMIHCARKYVEPNDYGRCISLAKYAMINFQICQHVTLLYLYQILCTIGCQCHNNRVQFVDAADMLRSLVANIPDIMSSYADRVSSIEDKDGKILMYVAMKLLQLCHLTSTDADISSFRQLASALVQTGLRTPDGKTLLHFAASEARSGMVESLLRAGAAVNDVDSAGNTPLHVATFNRPETSMTSDWEKTVEVLLNHGAHVDAANAKGEVASDKLPANVDVFNYSSLQCLAARTIRAYQLPYRGILPKRLADFVELH